VTLLPGRLIGWSLGHRLAVIGIAVALVLVCLPAVRALRLDAIPDLSEVQVIVQTPWPGQSPQAVEDQVTYPLASVLLATPSISAVRGFSVFGQSFLYVIFRDGTDPYWARSRVTEGLAQALARLPAGASPALGPDASGVGWVFEYALVDRGHKLDPDRLRALQDTFVALELQAIPGVAEVASVGGIARQYQVEIDPARLSGYGLGLERVGQAIRDSNLTGGGGVVEMGRAEYMVRSPGRLASLEDFRTIPLGVDARNRALRLSDVARVQIGAEPRVGVIDINGEGDAAGGIVVLRHGGDALDVAQRVQRRLHELQRSLPAGVEIVVTYDRSGLIRGAVGTLVRRLIEESLVVAAVCALFLWHLRSALVVLFTLPLGILAALAILSAQGVSANLMSLGGIAIAIGAMVDAAIVLVENLHKHLEREPGRSRANLQAAVRASAGEVGPALFFSLLVITISFLPIFALTGQEGRLFAPLALTKTYAMAASALLALTLTPVLMGVLVRGPVRRERDNPVNRVLHRVYLRALTAALRRPGLALALAAAALASCAWPLAHLGSEFMPPMFEGSVLYMPSTLPSVSMDEAARALQVTDRLLLQLPEVAAVFGKAGRAQSATDPAPTSMFETVVTLRPREQWPAGETTARLLERLDAQIGLPGITNGWGYPIRTRIDMLATGIRTPLGIKVGGPDLDAVAGAARAVEQVLRTVPGTRGAFADRPGAGRYLDVEIDRRRAASLGVTTADLQAVVQGAIGGETVTTVLEGRERHGVSLRYARAWRESPQSIADIPFVTPAGTVVRLGDVARVAVRDGPAEIKSENARLTAYVTITLADDDLEGYVGRADRALAALRLPPGVTLAWSGQYEQLQHARTRLGFLVPATIAAGALLLFLYFRDWMRVGLVLLCLPFSLVGGLWLVHLLGYPLSVAVAVGFIALAGVALEFGVVMLLYLDQAARDARRGGMPPGPFGQTRALLRGACSRVRPKMMTVAVIVAGLLPVMLGEGLGSDVMKRIAAPLVGGMLTAPLLSLFLIPILYHLRFRRDPPGPAAPREAGAAHAQGAME
jgi:Cu(I)/Ag(I) efflux system membrane protein CusA/SilA